VVGAGLAGAVHARLLAEAGHQVQVIERRPHPAGNAHDRVDANGVRVHVYGPHLFHTNNVQVAAWVRRFAVWLPYEHRVRARLPDGRHVPLPVNLDTINAVHGAALRDAAEAEAFLARLAVRRDGPPRNAAEWLQARIGHTLTDLLFRPYTRKMWALDLEEMDASVVKRVPLRFDREDRYFPEDGFQALPAGGYTRFVEAVLDHPAISVALSTGYAAGMERGYRHCFNSMPIDEYFGFDLGELPYRSLRFHHTTAGPTPRAGWATTNFTDTAPITRITRWELLPGHLVEETGRRTLTSEEPCDYRENELERYYPVKTANGVFQRRYEAYRSRAAREAPQMSFIGRCGTYQYLDMDQVINQSLRQVRDFLDRGAPPR